MLINACCCCRADLDANAAIVYGAPSHDLMFSCAFVVLRRCGGGVRTCRLKSCACSINFNDRSSRSSCFTPTRRRFSAFSGVA